MADNIVALPRSSNQALGIAKYAVQFLRGEGGPAGDPSPGVLARTQMFYTDAQLCGISALALGANAPNRLWHMAQTKRVVQGVKGVPLIGGTGLYQPEWAALVNGAAVREWDANGTSFAYFPKLGLVKGEFGHNDWYGLAIAAAQLTGQGGKDALRGMVLHDQIRVILGGAFALKDYRIDHVLHGGIASAAVWGAMTGATPEQIEMGIGAFVAHHVPFRAIRAGHHLSDSKGASAGITMKAAIEAMDMCANGFIGPRDIFRNPLALFRLMEGPGQYFARIGSPVTPNITTEDASPFDLYFALAGDEFAIQGMHTKLGLYEHQSASAIQALIDLLTANPHLLNDIEGGKFKKIVIKAYRDAFNIIGDPAKRDPHNRQSADHSMCYIIATLIRKALETKRVGWKELMLVPEDYAQAALFNPVTRRLMSLIHFEWGGPTFDAGYPEGIPTSMDITDLDDRVFSSGLVMFPGGHAANHRAPNPVAFDEVVRHKWQTLGALAVADPSSLVNRYMSVGTMSHADLLAIDQLPFAIGEATAI